MDGAKQPDNENGSWQFNPSDSPATTTYAEPPAPQTEPAPAASSANGITWTASEFVAHSKGSGWYGLLALGAFVAAVLIWLITKDWVSSLVILVAAGMLGSFAARQPRDLTYTLDDHGLTIGGKFYNYGMFRSFAIQEEGALTNIVFTPLQRFSPLTTIYYDPNDEERIVDLLANRLPMEERKRDAIDRLMWRIRF